jgi:hypothetical protein
VFEILLSLSIMGFGKDARLERLGVSIQCDELGRYRLDYSPGNMPWKVGEMGMANKWITLYSLLAHKYK